MENKRLDKASLSQREDWYGNNAAICCPVCGKVFIFSCFINKGVRQCPKCEQTVGRITDESVMIEWPRQPQPIVFTRAELETADRIDEFVQLVSEGGAVSQQSLDNKLPKTEMVAIIEHNHKMTAAAAKKRPSLLYARDISEKSGYSLAGDVPELGYVVVSHDYRGRGLSSMVVGKILPEFNNGALFATTSSPRMKCMLANNGFRWVGKEWDSMRSNERLSLWTREVVR